MKRPTAVQKRRMSKVAALGCLPCLMDGNPGTPATIHHCHNYGYRDHFKIIAICPQHHQYQFAVSGMPNREKNPIEFAERYGSDDELHLKICKLLGEIEDKL